MKKLEVLFSVFLVVVLVVPSLSLGAWVGPSGSFSILSPDPELPISEGNSKQGKSANISIPQINISGDVEYLQKTQNTLPETNSITLGFNKGLSWGSNFLSVGSTGFFNFVAEGIKLPSRVGEPSSPVAGTIYYDSAAKEVKLFDGTWKSIGSGAAAPTNPLLLKYGTGTNQSWSITSAADGSKGSKLSFSNPDGGDLVYINYNENSGKGNLVLAPGTKLCFNGAASGADCKDAWPTAQQGGSSQWKDLTGGIYYNAGSVSIGSNEPKAALRISGGTNQLYIDSDTGTYLDGAGGGYNQSEPIVFHVGGAQLIARNADFDGTNWKRAKYGTVSAIAFGGGDERNDAPAGDIQFLTAPYGDAGSNIGTFKNVLTIKNNGNVGVGGEPDSKYKFDVKSGYINLGNASSEVMIPGGATLDEGLLVRSGGLIVSGGNVGIGTDSPDHKLTVVGGNIDVKMGGLVFETMDPPAAIPAAGCFIGSAVTSDYAKYRITGRTYAVSYLTTLGAETTLSPDYIECASANTVIKFQVPNPNSSVVAKILVYRKNGSSYERVGFVESDGYFYDFDVFTLPGTPVAGIPVDTLGRNSRHTLESPVPGTSSEGGIYVKGISETIGPTSIPIISFYRNGSQSSIGINRKYNPNFTISFDGKLGGSRLDGATDNTGEVRMRWVNSAQSSGLGEGWYPYAVYAP